jgi:hypothetical protein
MWRRPSSLERDRRWHDKTYKWGRFVARNNKINLLRTEAIAQSAFDKAATVSVNPDGKTQQINIPFPAVLCV